MWFHRFHNGRLDYLKMSLSLLFLYLCVDLFFLKNLPKTQCLLFHVVFSTLLNMMLYG